MTTKTSTIGIWGVGLIGGSLGLALRKANPAVRLIGIGRSSERLQKAIDLGAISEAVNEDAIPFDQMDLLVLAVPLSVFESALSLVAKNLPPKLVLTDVGSAKASLMEQAAKILGDRVRQFVPAHPIAGRELSGVEAALDDLYLGKKVILTPSLETDIEAVIAIEQLWQSVGAKTERWDATDHDLIYGLVSHLPQILSTNYMNSLAQSTVSKELLFGSAGSGMRDFSRLASSDAQMWRDICLANSASILSAMDHFETTLADFRQALQNQDEARLFSLFQQAKALRNAYF